MIDLSIVIVSFNTRAFLHECLTSIKDNVSDAFTYETIVVDNASSDDSVGMVKKEFPWVRLLENTDNLGFSKANNIGVKQSHGRYVLFLNSDTVVYKDTLETMVLFMDEHKDAGAATCKLVLTNN